MADYLPKAEQLDTMNQRLAELNEHLQKREDFTAAMAKLDSATKKAESLKDGFSPTVSVTETDEGTTITFTDKDGEKVANIKNGKQGDKGDKGDTGATGPEIRIVNYSPIGTTPKDLIADGLDWDFGEDTQVPTVGETVIILWQTLVMDSDESHTYLVHSEIDSIGDDMWGHLSFSWSSICDITGEDGSDGLPALVCNSAYSSPTYTTLKIGEICQLHGGDFSRNAAVGDVFHLVWKDTGADRTYIVTAQVISIQEGYVNGKVLSFADITGKDGADGFSPTATVTQTSTGADISVTDKNGTTNAHIENGSDANVTAENIKNALGYTPLETAPVTSVNGKVGAVEIAASDVGAISSADGSVQNAHLADASVTTDKLAEAERMTSANIVGALGYEPEEKSGEWELIEEITLTEDTAAIERTAEPDGTAYNFQRMAVTFRTPFKSSGYVNVRFSDDDLLGVYLRVNTSSASDRCAYSKAEAKQDAGYWHVYSWEYLNGYSSTNASYITYVLENAESYYAYSWPLSQYPQISYLHIWGNASWTMPAGTIIKIYGIRA